MGVYQEASERTKINVTNNYSDKYVHVSPSKYLEKLGVTGNGLYTNQEYKAGTPILEYKGKIVTDEQAERKTKKKQYMFDVKKGKKIVHVIDGANNRFASAAKFVNSTRTFASRERNAEFKQYSGRIYLVASKNIRKNKEILAYYGSDTLRIIDAK